MSAPFHRASIARPGSFGVVRGHTPTSLEQGSRIYALVRMALLYDAKVGVAGSNPVVRSRSEALSGASDSRPGPSIARAGSFGGHHRLLAVMEQRATTGSAAEWRPRSLPQGILGKQRPFTKYTRTMSAVQRYLVSASGQMSVPAAVRHRWELDQGGPVDVIDLGFGVLTVPAGQAQRLLGDVLSREDHAAFVASLADDPDLATT